MLMKLTPKILRLKRIQSEDLVRKKLPKPKVEKNQHLVLNRYLMVE